MDGVRKKLSAVLGKAPSITLKNMKIIIWFIDDHRFNGEIKKAKGREWAVGYHADVGNSWYKTDFPYYVSFNRTSSGGFIHIATPGNILQQKHYAETYGLEFGDTLGLMMCIAEDILLIIGYEVYQHRKILPSISNEQKQIVIDCVRRRVFDR